MTSTEPVETLIVGDPAIGCRDSAQSIYTYSDVVGRLEPRLHRRRDAGGVYVLFDIIAPRAALYFMYGIRCGAHFEMPDHLSVVTLSFNSATFTQAFFEGDLISVSAQVVHAGRTSIGLYTAAHRQGFDCATPRLVCEGYITMVVVDVRDVTRPRPGHVPAVRLVGRDEIRHNRIFNAAKQMPSPGVSPQPLPPPGSTAWSPPATTTATTSSEVLRVGVVELPCNAAKRVKLEMCRTTIAMNRMFGADLVNVNKVIFGGAIVQCMEQAALHCGRVFAEVPRLFTLGMLCMTFDSPIHLQDLATCTAHVACVRESTLLVEVRVDAEGDQESRTTNRAYFLLIHLDEKGVPCEIPKGLDLTNATQVELQSYWKARRVMEASEEWRWWA